MLKLHILYESGDHMSGWSVLHLGTIVIWSRLSSVWKKHGEHVSRCNLTLCSCLSHKTPPIHSVHECQTNMGVAVYNISFQRVIMYLCSALATVGSVDHLQKEEACDTLNGLVKRQKKICKRNIEVMHAIQKGAIEAIEECQYQFQNRRWNCSTVPHGSAIFGNVLNAGRSFTWMCSFLTYGCQVFFLDLWVAVVCIPHLTIFCMGLLYPPVFSRHL